MLPERPSEIGFARGSSNVSLLLRGAGMRKRPVLSSKICGFAV
jgi:hypothetical protein